MKIYIYMVVLIAFIMVFQQNPVAGFIMIAVFGLGYYFFKVKKKNGRGFGMRNGFFSGQGQQQADQTNLILQLMMIEKMGNLNGQTRELDIDDSKQLMDAKIEDRKTMVLSYFGDD